MKMMRADEPSRGFRLMRDCGLLELIFPELLALAGVEVVNGRGHKDNFDHTLQVLDNVAAHTQMYGFDGRLCFTILAKLLLRNTTKDSDGLSTIITM